MADDGVTRSGDDSNDFDVRPMVDHYVEIVSAIPGIRSLFLVGSFGRRAADRWSDVDLLAVCEDTEHVSRVADDIAASVGPDLLMITRRGSEHLCLLNMIFPPWVRVDVSLTDDPAPQGLHMSGRRLVFGGDPEPMNSSTGNDVPTAEVDHARATEIVKQFARIFGLLPTVLGREDLITARSGCSLVWEQLVDLCLLATPEASRMGALSQTASLSAKHRALLLGIPPVENSHASIITFHEVVWKAMLEVLASPAFDSVERPSLRTLTYLQTWLAETVGLTIDLA